MLEESWFDCILIETILYHLFRYLLLTILNYFISSCSHAAIRMHQRRRKPDSHVMVLCYEIHERTILCISQFYCHFLYSLIQIPFQNVEPPSTSTLVMWTCITLIISYLLLTEIFYFILLLCLVIAVHNVKSLLLRVLNNSLILWHESMLMNVTFFVTYVRICCASLLLLQKWIKSLANMALSMIVAVIFFHSREEDVFLELWEALHWGYSCFWLLNFYTDIWI